MYERCVCLLDPVTNQYMQWEPAVPVALVPRCVGTATGTRVVKPSAWPPSLVCCKPDHLSKANP
jgi:hypothetical protein